MTTKNPKETNIRSYSRINLQALNAVLGGSFFAGY